MNKLIIDIGNHSIRALLYDGDTRNFNQIQLSYTSKMFIPTLAVIDNNDKIVAVGEDALLWKHTNPEALYRLEDIKEDSLLVDFICIVCHTVVRRVQKSGREVNMLVITLPPNIWKQDSTVILKKLTDLGIHDIRHLTVTNGYSHILQKCYAVNQGEYVLLYDIGYTHTTIVLAQKTSCGLQIVNQFTSTDFSGRMIDSIIFGDIESTLAIPDYEDLTMKLLYNSVLEESIEYIKRKCSGGDSFSCPIPNAEGMYECNVENLQRMISKPLGDTFSMVAQKFRDSKIEAARVKQVVLYGSTCRLPFIASYLKKYLASNLGINVNEIKNIATQEIHSELYGCKAAINL